MKKSKSEGITLAIYVLLFIAMAFGYCRCVYKFVECDFSKETSWKPEVVYGIGTFSGLGIVIGYLELGK